MKVNFITYLKPQKATSTILELSNLQQRYIRFQISHYKCAVPVCFLPQNVILSYHNL